MAGRSRREAESEKRKGLKNEPEYQSKISRLSDRALVRAWLGGLLVAAFGGVAAVNALRLGADAPGVALAVLAGAGFACAFVGGCVMSGRAAE